MFDLNDNTLTRTTKGSAEDRLQVTPDLPDVTPEHPLDSASMTELHGKMLNYYRTELEIQAENRAEQATDEDYFDSIQVTAEQKAELDARGQPANVYNVIQQSVNWVTGSERRGRTDFKILPRGKEDAKAAERKTKYLKYLSDVNRTPFHRSRAFEDAVKTGIGWLEVGVQDEDDGEPIYDRYESWRNLIWDSSATEMDGSDMRYQFRPKWVDEDVALAIFSDRKAQISAAVSDSISYGSYEMYDGDEAMDAAETGRGEGGIVGGVSTHVRRRVKLIEGWYRMPEVVMRIKGGAFNGQIYDESDKRHVEAREAGIPVTEKVMMRVRVCIMTTRDMIWEGPSPYRHNRFKFIPIWGYRRGRDGLPYGMIRGLRDIQDDVNKRMSKALHILSSNKVIMEEGALPDEMSLDEFADEIARSDAVIVKRKGYAMDINVDRELAPAHLDLASRNIQMIQQVGGVTDELMGRQTNATSGVAVQRRQEQGSLATSRFFDNLRLAEQIRGEIQLSLVEQYATEKKQFRVTNQRGGPEFVDINDGLPENDITRSKADFVISEADWRSTMRQAAAEQFGEMLNKMSPEVALTMLDLWAETQDISNRDEVVKRIRQINGQRDPEATEVSAEEQAAMQAKQQASALQQAAMEANMKEQAARIAKLEAEAERIRAQTIGDKITATQTAMVAAGGVIATPTIARVADGLLQEAGWNNGVSAAANGLPPLPQQQAAPAAPEPVAAPIAAPEQAELI